MSDDDTPLEQLVGGAVMALTFLAGFGMLALGVPWFWVAFPVGFAGVLPAAIGAVRLYERRQQRRREAERPTDQEAALARLRDRYAAGEIDEAEFEERVERLVETESIADAEAYVERRTGPVDGGRDRDRDRDRTAAPERDPE